jgi:hypothetical protein
MQDEEPLKFKTQKKTKTETTLKKVEGHGDGALLRENVYKCVRG